jgi:hypothetical protein
MKIMDRRFLFAALAASAWAQQQSNPAAVQAEQALRDRVQQFYQLQTDEKYRQAESMVADDTKDDYYNGKKPKIKGFTVEKIDLNDDLTKAKVLIKAKVLVLMPGAGAQIFEMPTPTTWKLENGEWRWYIAPEAKVTTPFGKINTTGDKKSALNTNGQAPGGIDNPNLGALLGQVSIDGTAVELTRNKRDQQLTIKNGLQGSVDLKIDPHVEVIMGLTVSIDKTHLEGGENAVVQFHLTGEKKISDTVEIVALPLNRVFDIQVTAK